MFMLIYGGLIIKAVILRANHFSRTTIFKYDNLRDLSLSSNNCNTMYRINVLETLYNQSGSERPSPWKVVKLRHDVHADKSSSYLSNRMR